MLFSGVAGLARKHAARIHLSPDQSAATREFESSPSRSRGVSTASRVSLIVIAVIASIWALQWAKEFLIPLAVAIFMTFWLMPLVDGLARLRIPRSFGAALVLALTIFAIGSSMYWLRDDARAFSNGLSAAAHKVRVAYDQAMRDPDGWLHDLRIALTDRTAVVAKGQTAPDTSIDLQSALVRSSTTAVSTAVDVTVVLFLMYFLLASGDLFRRKLLAAISGQLARRRVTVEILNEIGTQFQRYLAVLSGTNIAIGILTWLVFSLFGVAHAAVWGVAACLLHLIPYLGPAIVALASLLVTIVQFNSLSAAAAVAGSSLAISALIGMVLTTTLASRASNMNSVAVFVGLLFWGWLWGVPGLLLGTPLMMAINVVAERVECLHWLATFLCGAPRKERKPRTTESAAGEALTESSVAGVAEFVPSEMAAETGVLAKSSTAAASRDAEPENRELADEES